MDPINDPAIYPIDLQMKGDHMQIPLNRGLTWFYFIIRVSRSYHVMGDPLFDCQEYSEEATYGECVHDELKKIFLEKLGCSPPVLANRPGEMCNERFNLSRSKEDKIFDLVHQLGFQDWESKCRIPCTRSKYTKRYLAKESSSYPVLDLIFDRTVEVTHSTFSMNEQTL